MDKWMHLQPLNQEDIIVLLTEYDQTFNEGKVSPQEILTMLQFPPVQMGLNDATVKAIKRLSIKKGLEWADIYNEDGSFVARYWLKEPVWDDLQ